MAITLKRQLSNDDKERVLKEHGRKCFATGHLIGEGEPVHYDHIKAFSRGGSTELNNIAPMCEQHNQQKGNLPLYDFRIQLRVDKFFDRDDRDKLTLQDELVFLKKEGSIEKYGETVSIGAQNSESITVELNNRECRYPLHRCAITGWEYFYALLPVDVINSDDDTDREDGLQPRYLIRDKLVNLFQHFQKNPVLQPSLCRIRNGKVLAFDGQHKIAAMLWNGHKEFECKVYVNPDIRLLNETNISAHDKYAQTRFYSSIMVEKLGSVFEKDFLSYKNDEDGCPKSEKGFFDYLQRKKGYSNGEVNKQFRSWLYHQALESKGNHMAKFVSAANRSTSATPITMDVLGKSIFRFMCPEPTTDDIAKDAYLRDQDVNNMKRLCCILVDEALGAWDASKKNDPYQIKLKRVFGSKSMMAWSDIVHDAICAKMEIYDSGKRKMCFYQHIGEDDFERVRMIVSRLVSWKRWDDPANSEIDQVLAGKKSNIATFFDDNGLSAGYLMGAQGGTQT